MPKEEKFNIPFVVIFIPAYNEEEAIDKVIEHIQAELQDGTHEDFYSEIIVINDGSSDDTHNKAKEAGVRVVSHPINKGLGAATRTGMREAFAIGADIAVKVDGDLQNNPKDILKVIKPILEDRADVVFGSRFLGSILYKMPTYRRLGNKFFSWLAGFLTGLTVTDSTTGLIASNRNYLSIFTILFNYNETQQLIVDAWGKKMRVVEVPITTPERKTGKSFISWKYPFKVIPAIIRTYFHVKPFRSFFIIGLILFLAGVYIGVGWFLGKISVFGDATAAILILMGLQIMLFGLLADVIKKQ